MKHVFDTANPHVRIIIERHENDETGYWVLHHSTLTETVVPFAKFVDMTDAIRYVHQLRNRIKVNFDTYSREHDTKGATR